MRYIFRVVLPMILIAFFLEKIYCIKKEASLFPRPLINEGVLPSFLKHSFTTASRGCGLGAVKLIFTSADLK